MGLTFRAYRVLMSYVMTTAQWLLVIWHIILWITVLVMDISLLTAVTDWL